MILKQKEKKIDYIECILFVYLLLYGIFSFSFLTKYPFVHSDESWLAGLSRNMMEMKSLSVTESFFDARVRYPHAIKSLFHILQMVFIQLFGYSVESVRMLSLVGGILFLFLFYVLIKQITGRKKLALAIVILFSADAEFFYASHFARQEIWLGVCLILGLWVLFSNMGKAENKSTNQAWKIRKAALAAVITGISIGFHPNSFLLACSMGAILLFEWLSDRAETEKVRGVWKPLAVYIGVTGIFAALFVGISYSFDAQFLTHYFQNGALEFDVDASIITKAGALGGFFKKLMDKFSGTYYITELRFSLILFAFLVVFLGIYALVMKEKKIGTILFGGLGLLAGMVIIGRYNQTSIFFLFPFGYLMFAILLSLLERGGRIGCYMIVLLITVVISAGQIKPWVEKDGYEAYLDKVEKLVPADAKVVANLNLDFYFENGCLRDYRNLPYALEQGTIEAYMDKNEIEYVIYSTELDYLYENRPYFNVIYGNTEFVPELKRFCEVHGEKMGEFIDVEYGCRVIGIMGQEEYSNVIVYKVNRD